MLLDETVIFYRMIESLCLLLQLYKFDAIIRTTSIAMQQTGKKIDSVTAYDYRSIMVPLLKSLM